MPQAFESMTSYADDWDEIDEKTAIFLGDSENSYFHDIGDSSVSKDPDGIFSFTNTGTYSIEISGELLTPAIEEGGSIGVLDLMYTDDGGILWNKLHSIIHFDFNLSSIRTTHRSSYYYKTNIDVDNIATDKLLVTVDGTSSLDGSSNIVFSKLVPITLTQGETGPQGEPGIQGEKGEPGI